MRIEHRPERELGSFVAVESGEDVGELAYRMTSANEMCRDHTEVEPAFEGKGVGRQLIQAAVDHAREHGVKLRPVCSYAQVIFDRNTDWADIRV
ncbi:MAG: N-acetyltransferase [Bacteroidota bacterium]|nr:N-acetyltransferase [Bacteroidota bacterium]